MPDFLIKISTTADLTGATAVIQAQEQIGQASTSSGAAATQAANQTAAAQEKVAQTAAAIGPAAAGIEPLLAELARIVAASQSAGAGLAGIDARLEAMQQHAIAQGQALALMTSSIDLGIGKLNEATAAVSRATVKPLADSANEAKKELSEAEQEAEHLVNALRQGVAIDIGHRLVESVAEIPAKFREMIDEGVRFNAEMQIQTISLQGAFRAASPERYLNFNAAREDGEAAMNALREKANELGLDFHGLAHGLVINMAGLMEGGIHDIQQQIDLITTLNQAAQAKGLQGFQASRDITDLLNGRANRTLFGAELGIRDEDVRAAREAGKLYEFLNEKLAAYKEGGEAAANTFVAAEQRLKNETEQLYGEIAKPVSAGLLDALREINAGLKDGNLTEELRGLGYDVAEVVKDGAELLRWALALAPILGRVAEGVGLVGVALALLKLPGLISALGAKSLAWLRNAEAIDAETAALARNTGAAEANAVAKRGVPGGAGGAAGGGFLSTEGTAAAIGTGLVALEAGVALIQLYEAHENELLDAIKRRSEAESQTVVTNLKQIDQADTLAKKDAERAKLKQQIADLDAQIAHNEQRAFTEDGAGGGVYFDDDPDSTQLLRNQRGFVQHQLDTFDTHAGQDQGGQRERDAQAKKDAAALDAYKQSSDYQLTQAELSGDQTAINDRKYDKEVEKIKAVLIEKHKLGEQDAEAEAQSIASAQDRTNEAKKLSAEMERITAQVEKQRDAAEVHRDLLAKQADLLKDLPAGTGSDVGALTDAVAGLPQADDEQFARKSRLADVLREIVALTKEAAAADRREDAEKKRADDDARKDQDAHAAIQDANDRAAINEARAAGRTDEADELDRQMRIRQETARLERGSVTNAEAHATAERAVNAEIAARDAKETDRDTHHQRRPALEPHHRHGERESVPTVGYHARPGDAGYAGAGSATDGFVDANRPPSSVATPGLPRLPDLFPHDLQSLSALGIGSFAPTAAAGLAPVLSPASIGVDTSPAQIGGAAGTTNDPFSAAAAKFGSAADQTLGRAAASVDTLKEQLNGLINGLAGKISALATEMENAKSQIAHLP